MVLLLAKRHQPMLMQLFDPRQRCAVDLTAVIEQEDLGGLTEPGGLPVG